MKKIVNGELVEMTPEEIAEMEQIQAELPTSEPTPEDRLAALEQASMEQDAALMELAAMLAGGK